MMLKEGIWARAYRYTQPWSRRVWFHEDPEKACIYHLKHGTTSMLATTLIRPTHKQMTEDIRTIVNAVKIKNSLASKTIIGIHMEGPYMNPNMGLLKSTQGFQLKRI